MNGLDKLRDIGLEELFKKTHIQKTHIQALLHESFDEFTAIQFVGFISILEREYNLDLSQLKEKGLKYIEEHNSSPEPQSIMCKEDKKEPKSKVPYIVGAVFILLTLIYLNEERKSQQVQIVVPKVKKIPTKIYVENEEEKQKSVEEDIVKKEEKVTEENIINNIKKREKVVKKEEKKVTKPVHIPKPKPTPKKEPKPVSKNLSGHILKINTKQRLWIGYIELPSHKKHTKIFKGELNLDTSKTWLIVTAHGFLSIDVDKNHKKYRTKSILRFLYKNHKLEKIDVATFKKLNKGKKW